MPPIVIRESRGSRRPVRSKPTRVRRSRSQARGAPNSSRSQPARRGKPRKKKEQGSILGALLALALLWVLVNSIASNNPTDADVREAPAVSALVSCDAPGAGYRVVPVWPGDRPGLAGYRVGLETLFVGELGFWRSAATLDDLKPLVQLPPGIEVKFSMVAEMADGTRSEPGHGSVTLPPAAC